jgi:hypothetical protein
MAGPPQPAKSTGHVGTAATQERSPGEWSGGSGLRFIILFGVVSMFADMAYEGARSITGPFLASLGASGLIVGSVSGLGEMLGYVVRLASGRGADRSRRYWPIALGGYLVQLPAVPLLALAPGWPVVALLIALERIGKGTRNPVRSTMLAEAGEHVGQGWAFGIHEAMDKGGALIGPLIIAGILAVVPNGYRTGFAWLAVPVGASLLTLMLLRFRHPRAGLGARGTSATGEWHYPPASRGWRCDSLVFEEGAFGSLGLTSCSACGDDCQPQSGK